MSRRIFAILFGVLVCAGTLLANTANAAQRELNFGIINTEASQNLKSLWQPFLKDMEKMTGLKINAFFASDYSEPE